MKNKTKPDGHCRPCLVAIEWYRIVKTHVYGVGDERKKVCFRSRQITQERPAFRTEILTPLT